MDVSVTYTWLLLLIFVPVGGAVLYLLIGELNLGKRKLNRAALLGPEQLEYSFNLAKKHPFDFSKESIDIQSIYKLARGIKRFPALTGNSLKPLHDSQGFFSDIEEEIRKARKSIHLLFYIWDSGGEVAKVEEALKDAAKRGVKVKLMIDGVGSAKFRKSKTRKSLMEAGVFVQTSLKVNIVRMWFQRVDLRNHRKIVVIDERIAYTGSQNMVDPRYFKQDEDVGQWIDTMIKVEGPSVLALNAVFAGDWSLDTDAQWKDLVTKLDDKELAVCESRQDVQIIPSSPGAVKNSIHEIIMGLLYNADKRITITTPYFVPSEAMLKALCSKSISGCDVTLITPRKSDSVLVKYASQSVYEDLLNAGVKIALFENGLLHSKIITIDEKVTFVGSHNMDMRSFYINFEVSMMVYSKEFCRTLVDRQDGYIANCHLLTMEEWKKRSFSHRLKEDILRLVSPVL
jgi:cardiolipin synthase